MVVVVLAAGILNGCTVPDPNQLPGTTYKLWSFFPYVLRNATYTSYISIANSSPWAMDVTITYRNPAGAVVVTDQRRLSGHETYRYVPGTIEGSMEIKGIGDLYAIHTNMEIRTATGNAAALVPPATIKGTYGIPWFIRTGVLDDPGGTVHSKLISTSLYPTPIYLFFSPMPKKCKDMFETKVNPYQLYMFQPADRFKGVASTGLTDWVVYVSGNKGPNGSVSQRGEHTGSVFTTASEDISFDSYAEVNPNYWSRSSGFPHQDDQLYLVDVQDDGVNRADRIYIKSNGWGDPNNVYHEIPVHFYATDGSETTKVIAVYREFDTYGSVKMLSPKDLLGNNFKGSVWIEQSDAQASLRRVAPGKWSDMSGSSPAGSLLTGCVPYVNTTETNWRYQLALFYPINIYPTVHPGGDIPAIRYIDPSQSEPVPEPGEVVLTLWNVQGGHEGWVVVFLGINETAYVDMKDLATNYLMKPFEGSIQFDPLVVLEVELVHESGLAHGSVNTWQSGQQ